MAYDEPPASLELPPNEPLVLAFTGMPASGKGEAVKAARTAPGLIGPGAEIAEPVASGTGETPETVTTYREPACPGTAYQPATHPLTAKADGDAEPTEDLPAPSPPTAKADEGAGHTKDTPAPEPPTRDLLAPGLPCPDAMLDAHDMRGPLPVVRMGDLIWERCEKLGLELTPENVGRVANAERESQGKDVWAKATVTRIRELLGELEEATDGVGTGPDRDPSREPPRTSAPGGRQPGTPTPTPAPTPAARLPGTPNTRPPITLKPRAAIIDGLRSPAELGVFREAFGHRLKVIAIICPASARASRIGARGRIDDTTDAGGFEARDRRELAWGLEQVIKAADQTIDNSGTLADLRDDVRRLVRDLLGSARQ